MCDTLAALLEYIMKSIYPKTIITMQSDHNATLIEDIKEQINNLTYQPDEFDTSSFAQSRNGPAKLSIRESPKEDYSNRVIFPVVQAPTLVFETDPHLQIPSSAARANQQEFCRAQSQVIDDDDEQRDDSLDDHRVSRRDLIVQNKKLKEAHTLLQNKIVRLQKSKMLDTFGQSDKPKSSGLAVDIRIKRLEEDIRQRDKKNIELHNQIKTLTQENRILKQDSDKKSKQLSNKIIEMKREHDKYEQVLSKLKQYEEALADSRLKSDPTELKEKQIQIKKLKNQVVLLNTNLYQSKEESQTLRLELLRQQQESKKVKVTNKQLLQRLKSQLSKANSIRNSTVSNTSLMESFSPQMLSPEQTIELIYQIFKRVSKSTRMLKVLYDNTEFVHLIQQFSEDRLRRRSDYR